MNYLLEGYLAFIQEREWDDPDDPGSKDPAFLGKVMGKLTGSDVLAQKRQYHQPSLINIYVKHALGDYRGRADMLNTLRFKKAGIDDWKDAKKILKKAIDHEKKLNPAKFLKGIKTVQNISKEPLGKEAKKGGGTSADSYTDGVSTGPQAMTGGPQGGGGQ
jgi:hypothetical protein